VGGHTIKALHTPGHTAGSMCFLTTAGVFTGDTLLIGGCGRTDFQSGSAQSLYHSLTQVLFALPEDTVVWPGHDYKGKTQSTIGMEKRSNPRLVKPDGQWRSEAEFVTLMEGLNLPKPKRIHEAVPANLSLGVRHDADAMAQDSPKPVANGSYAGDVSPHLAWQWWQAGQAVLVDVRTDAERAWVGFVPDALAIEWKSWPGMLANTQFEAQLQERVARHKAVLFLCRSGVRSIAAAQKATELGYEAYNILEGFEGDPDEGAHRGKKGGWRFHGLPWRQS
jgi:sulfur dioxygenase